MAKLMMGINIKVTIEGADFGQQYIIKKKAIYKERGPTAAVKELDQLH